MQGGETGKSKLKEYATNALLRKLRKKIGETLGPRVSCTHRGIHNHEGCPPFELLDFPLLGLMELYFTKWKKATIPGTLVKFRYTNNPPKVGCF